MSRNKAVLVLEVHCIWARFEQENAISCKRNKIVWNLQLHQPIDEFYTDQNANDYMKIVAKVTVKQKCESREGRGKMALAWQPRYLATTYCNGPLTWQPGQVKEIFVALS